jgi:excisionase family DNA binding protein
MHTPRSAAKAAGVTKATIYRAIRSGQLPACKLRGGNYAIYPAELRRAFPSAAQASAGVTERSASTFLFPAWDVS